MREREGSCSQTLCNHPFRAWAATGSSHRRPVTNPPIRKARVEMGEGLVGWPWLKREVSHSWCEELGLCCLRDLECARSVGDSTLWELRESSEVRFGSASQLC